MLNRATRSIDKIVFKVPAKILPTYERSPHYIGTKPGGGGGGGGMITLRNMEGETFCVLF